jgi:hypothetical protein
MHLRLPTIILVSNLGSLLIRYQRQQQGHGQHPLQRQVKV